MHHDNDSPFTTEKVYEELEESIDRKGLRFDPLTAGYATCCWNSELPHIRRE